MKPQLRLATVLLALTLSIPAGTRAATPQTDFPTAGAAVDALIAAVQTKDKTSFRALMGPGSEHLLSSGDKIADATATRDFLANYALHHQLLQQGDDKAVLIVGTDDWPMPIPVVRANGRWHFDARTGAQEIIDRRIGRNEIAAIRTSLAFVDAEEAYHERLGSYATRLVSSAGKYDGLYWDTSKDEPNSPLGPLVAQAMEEGYPGATAAGKHLPYQGYFFRVLKGQGASASGGRQSYLAGGAMTGGYALLAWPAVYGSSGVVSFQVNQAGVVFQKDLGPNTAKLAAGINLFDPDLSWARVDITTTP